MSTHKHGQPRTSCAILQRGISQIVSSPRLLDAAALPPHDADTAFAACGGGHIDLSVAIAPASAFEPAVRSSDLAEGNTSGQITTPVNYASPQLAHVQAFPHGCSLEGEQRPGRTPPMKSTRAP